MDRHRSRLARKLAACPLLFAVVLLALGACTTGPDTYGGRPRLASPGAVSLQGSGGTGGSGNTVAILLPLTGPSPDLAQSMLKAAQLALSQPGSPTLIARDTHGTPDGAAAAARAALAEGAGIILGPLTNTETAAAGPVARAAGVPMLAFTSDSAQAQPGVWVLGITPAQQVRRLLSAAQSENKTRIAAVLPDGAFGAALADATVRVASATGGPPPTIRRYGGSFGQIDAALKDVADYSHRRGAIDSRVRAARARGDADGRREAAEAGRAPVGDAPFDALLLGDPGEHLAEIAPLLIAYDIGPNQVRVLGPSIWARLASKLSILAGAWYAAPNPAGRANFEQAYTVKYGSAPPALADFAYDAANVARVLAPQGRFTAEALTQPEGFGGVDGVFALQPDGTARRGLAIFQLDRGGSHIVQPSPETVSSPGV